MHKIIIALLFSTLCFTVSAQRISVEEYIEQYKEVAINEMKRTGIPASITLAQGILESENGNGELVKKSNNHFGIKCKNTWSGESVTHDDDALGECFRAYNNAAESYRDHSDFLKFNKRYAALFTIDPTDYAGWAKGLKRAGYATNPRYPELLIKYVEQYNLQQYSLAALHALPQMDIVKTETGSENNLKADVAAEKVKSLPVEPGIETDPDKIVTINNTKCVFVKKGTSLLAVANKNNIALSKLMEYNDLREEGLLGKSQYIYLRKKPKTGDKDFYIVQPGESLYDVAQNAGIQLQYLKDYNELNDDGKLIANTTLSLQPGIKAPAVIQPQTTIHLVAPKEGLYTIAKTYHVTVQQLKEWNKLDTEDLKIGQQIIVLK